MSDAPRAMWSDRPWAMHRPALTQLLREHAAAGARLQAPTAEQIEAAKQAALGSGRSSRAGVAVIPLVGVITPWPTYSFFSGYSRGLSSFRADLREAVADPDIKAIVLDVDSPGGMVALVPETADDVFAARQVKPVIAVSNTLAASAAYWIASQASTLLVTQSGDVGSVGVYQLHEDWSGWNERNGIDPTYIVADGSPHKVDGNMDEPLSEEAEAYLRGEINEIYDSFVNAIARGRGITADQVRADYGKGRTLSANRALEAGMVDDVATFEQGVALAMQEATAGTPSPAAAALADALEAAATQHDAIKDQSLLSLLDQVRETIAGDTPEGGAELDPPGDNDEHTPPDEPTAEEQEAAAAAAAESRRHAADLFFS